MGMVCGAVDQRMGSEVLAVVDHDCPELDEDEQCEIRVLVQGEDEREDMVRHGLVGLASQANERGGSRLTCEYPSRGWNACDANGVGTIHR